MRGGPPAKGDHTPGRPAGDPGGRRRPGFEGERGPCHPRGRGPRAREARPAPEGGGNADCGLPDGSRSHEVAGDSVGTLHPGGPVVRGRRPPAEVCHTLGPRGPGPSRGGKRPASRLRPEGGPVGLSDGRSGPDPHTPRRTGRRLRGRPARPERSGQASGRKPTGPQLWTAATEAPEATRSRAIPTWAECPENAPSSPAALAIAARWRAAERPERRPNRRASGFSGRISRRSATVPFPRYWTAPSPSWSVFERRIVSRPDPSGRSSTSAHSSAAASERRSMASRMTEASATSTAPRSRAASGDSVRPVGPTRGAAAVARIAASASAVSAAA